MKQITLKVSDEQAKKIEDGKLALALVANEQLDAEGGTAVKIGAMAASAQKLANNQAGVAFIMEQVDTVTAAQSGGARALKADATAIADAKAGMGTLIRESNTAMAQDQDAGMQALFVDFTCASKLEDSKAGLVVNRNLASDLDEPLGD